MDGEGALNKAIWDYILLAKNTIQRKWEKSQIFKVLKKISKIIVKWVC